jgi:hypothetical protein
MGFRLERVEVGNRVQQMDGRGVLSSNTLKMAAVQAKNFKIALVQLLVGANKNANLERARTQVLKAAKDGANVVVLPECFNRFVSYYRLMYQVRMVQDTFQNTLKRFRMVRRCKP